MKLKIDWRKQIKNLYLLGAIVSFGAGAFIAFLGNEASNVILIVFGFSGLAGGVMLFRLWRRHGDIRYTGKKEKQKGGPQPNTLGISKELVEFTHAENPLGQSQKCHNDGKYYYIQTDMLGTKQIFALPDDDDKERYYDPSEFANPVTMPSNERYFNWSASTMQKISVGVMGLIIAGEIIGLIAIGG